MDTLLASSLVSHFRHVLVLGPWHPHISQDTTFGPMVKMLGLWSFSLLAPGTSSPQGSADCFTVGNVGAP